MGVVVVYSLPALHHPAGAGLRGHSQILLQNSRVFQERPLLATHMSAARNKSGRGICTEIKVRYKVRGNGFYRTSYILHPRSVPETPRILAANFIYCTEWRVRIIRSLSHSAPCCYPRDQLWGDLAVSVLFPCSATTGGMMYYMYDTDRHPIRPYHTNLGACSRLQATM